VFLGVFRFFQKTKTLKFSGGKYKMKTELVNKIQASIENANNLGLEVSVDGILTEMANEGLINKELINAAGKIFE
jgi:hypothetical protein